MQQQFVNDGNNDDDWGTPSSSPPPPQKKNISEPHIGVTFRWNPLSPATGPKRRGEETPKNMGK